MPQLRWSVAEGQLTLATLFAKGVPAALAALRLTAEQPVEDVSQPKHSLRKLASLLPQEPVMIIRPPLATKPLSAACAVGPQPLSDPSISVIRKTAAVESFSPRSGSLNRVTLASTR